MAPNDTFVQPAFSKVLVSFAIGLLVGVAFVYPAVRYDLTPTVFIDPGPIGNVLMIGILSIMVIATGMFTLYRLFWLVDR